MFDLTAFVRFVLSFCDTVRAEMRMVRWMCGVKLKDRLPSKELRETRYRWHSLGIAAEQAAMVWACAAKRR